MRAFPVLSVYAIATAMAQTPPVTIKLAEPTTANTPSRRVSMEAEKRIAAAGPPIAGYVLGPGRLEIRTVIVTGGTPQLGELVPVPNDSAQLYLPPRQHYALVEDVADNPMAVWTLHRQTKSSAKPNASAIQGGMSHPDFVTFSPRGDAAALYSHQSGSLQVLGHLPDHPAVIRQLSLSKSAAPAWIAVTDDAELVIVALNDGSLSFAANGITWHALPKAAKGGAHLFIPNTHNLAISDDLNKTLSLLTNIDKESRGDKVLARDLRADSLAATKDGGQLVGVDLAGGQIWTIELESGTITTSKDKATTSTLLVLRDGVTFLLSTSPPLSVMRVDVTPESPIATIVYGQSKFVGHYSTDYKKAN